MQQQEFVNSIMLVLGLDEVSFITEMHTKSFGFRKFKTTFISPFFNLMETPLKFPFY